jgi:hypothetical protein
MEVVGALNRIADELVATEKQEQADDDKRASRETLTIILLFLTVIFTGGADVIFYCTMRYAREATDQQHTDTLTSDAIGREAFEAVQRAYIIVTDLIRSDTTHKDSVEWRYAPFIVNVGGTQTRDLSVIEISPKNMQLIAITNFLKPLTSIERREMCIADKLRVPPDPDMFVRSDQLRGDISTKILHFIVGPKQPIKIPTQETLFNSSIFAQTHNGLIDIPNVKFPYFFGEIVYNDVFPRTPIHVTKYCFDFEGIQAGDANHAGGFLVGYCRHWNCADDECEADKTRYEDEATKVASQCP